MQIELAVSDAQLKRCFPVMAELRPHLDERQFLEQVKRQRDNGYRLACLEDDGQVQALAGFRIQERLSWGLAMYVDDLVTTAAQRSKGYGARLFDWLVDFARDRGCGQLHLDSGVQRFAAHRFYLCKGMAIVAHHFSLNLDASA